MSWGFRIYIRSSEALRIAALEGELVAARHMTSELARALGSAEHEFVDRSWQAREAAETQIQAADARAHRRLGELKSLVRWSDEASVMSSSASLATPTTAPARPLGAPARPLGEPRPRRRKPANKPPRPFKQPIAPSPISSEAAAPSFEAPPPAEPPLDAQGVIDAEIEQQQPQPQRPPQRPQHEVEPQLLPVAVGEEPSYDEESFEAEESAEGAPPPLEVAFAEDGLEVDVLKLELRNSVSGTSLSEVESPAPEQPQGSFDERRRVDVPEGAPDAFASAPAPAPAPNDLAAAPCAAPMVDAPPYDLAEAPCAAPMVPRPPVEKSTRRLVRRELEVLLADPKTWPLKMRLALVKKRKHLITLRAHPTVSAVHVLSVSASTDSSFSVVLDSTKILELLGDLKSGYQTKLENQVAHIDAFDDHCADCIIRSLDEDNDGQLRLG